MTKNIEKHKIRSLLIKKYIYKYIKYIFLFQNTKIYTKELKNRIIFYHKKIVYL